MTLPVGRENSGVATPADHNHRRGAYARQSCRELAMLIITLATSHAVPLRLSDPCGVKSWMGNAPAVKRCLERLHP